MAKEIERKWIAELSADYGSTPPSRTRVIESAYLSAADPEVRIARYRGEKGSYQITVKKGKGIQREEVILDVTDEKGVELYALADARVAKVRDDFPVDNGHYDLKWEVDQYLGRYTGLVVVEIEVPHKTFTLPRLPSGVRLIQEVTEDAAFKNKALAVASSVTAEEIMVRYRTATAPF